MLLKPIKQTHNEQSTAICLEEEGLNEIVFAATIPIPISDDYSTLYNRKNYWVPQISVRSACLIDNKQSTAIKGPVYRPSKDREISRQCTQRKRVLICFERRLYFFAYSITVKHKLSDYVLVVTQSFESPSQSAHLSHGSCMWQLVDRLCRLTLASSRRLDIA